MAIQPKERKNVMRRRKMIGLLLGAVLFLCAYTASASYTGYFCKITPFVGDGSFGDHGGIYGTIYTQPDCDGDFLSWIYSCSTNHYMANCSDSDIYLSPSQEATSSITHLWYNAMVDGTKITAYTSTTNCAGTGECLTKITYNSN